MPTVTHVFKTFFPETSGGLEEAIRQCGSYAAARGFTVRVVCAGTSDCTVATEDGITTRFYKTNVDFFSNPFSLSFAKAFHHICRDTDLLHFHFPWPTAEILALGFHKNTPALVTYHCDIHKILPVKALYLPLIRQFLKKMDRICVTSRALFQNTPYLAPFGHKIREIPLFMNETRFSDTKRPDAAVTKFTDTIQNFALFVGVLRWYKGLDILLDAAKTTGGDTVIVGTGPLFKKLASRIHREKITNVHLLGFQDDRNLQWLIQKSKIVVLPSIAPAEAFGQILLEGLYFGKPLISTELGTGTSVVNRHGLTGIVIPPGSSRCLSLAMNALFENPQLRDRYAKNARQHYADNFRPTVQGEKYVRLYKELLHF